MAKELLVEGQIDGQKLINQLVRDGFPVAVAFWAKTSEEGFWHLYIASPSVDAERIGPAYGLLYESMRKIPSPWVEFSRIRLLNPANPIAQEAIAVRDHIPGRSPRRHHGKRLADLAIDEAYLYPPVIEAGSA